MFELPLLHFSQHLRGGWDAAGQFTGWGQWVAEAVATGGLLFTILRAPEGKASALVACYIGAAYWFTASTSFANPAAVMGRMFSDTFAGIDPASAIGFVLAQARGRGPRSRLGTSTLPPEDFCMTITIFHNPACGTSRNTLAMIRNSGVEPTFIEYLQTPPTKARLQELLAAMGTGPRELLREKGTPFAELDLANEKWADDELLDFMLAHPILINRPVVETPLGTRLCRPV